MSGRQERHLRRKAMRLLGDKWRIKEVLEAVGRSGEWLRKWRKRFEKEGAVGLHSQSRAPKHTPQCYSTQVRGWVAQTRRRLVKRRVGLIGARAIQRELEQTRVMKPVPSLSTIKRILHKSKLVHTQSAPEAYFPQPHAQGQDVLHAMDWTSRRLEGGCMVYAFHTVDLITRALGQTISPDKSLLTLRAHVLKVWKTLGLPHLLQLDNDATFCGGNKVKRLFGAFTRLCLYVGIELIFMPVREPKYNGVVEHINSLWQRAFWNRRRFTSLAHVQRATPDFEHWYTHDYIPPVLNGRSPAQAHRALPHTKLSNADIAALPDPLPITQGRVHFIRHVDEHGDISLLNETWHIHRRLAGHYVWATIITHEQRLRVYHRRSSRHPARLIKEFPYPISEPVLPLLPQFKRFVTRRRIHTML